MSHFYLQHKKAFKKTSVSLQAMLKYAEGEKSNETRVKTLKHFTPQGFVVTHLTANITEKRVVIKA